MFIAGLISLRQYELAIETALRDDLNAHAITLGIALEDVLEKDLPKVDNAGAQKLIDRLRTNTEIYSVLLFDKKGNLIAQSTEMTDESLRHPAELHEVLTGDKTYNIIRVIDGKKFASTILPVRIRGEMIGALELVKPLSLISKDILYARIYWLGTFILLLAVIFTIVYVVLRRNLSAPINSLLSAAEAVEHGNLEYQVKTTLRKDELGKLASQFNKMVDSLNEKSRAASKENENRLKLERELRHHERLALLGRVAAGVAHELGAPLNVIDARAEQLQNKTDIAPEKHSRNLQIIRSNVERITYLVRQLLNLARPYNLSLTGIDLTKSLERAIENIEVNAQNAGTEISFSAPENFTVKGDIEYLHQVWTNILTNALQEVSAGGKISVSICEAEIDEKKFAMVEIFDTGKGIAPENFTYLFDPFFTTKDIGEGTGLGLPIANRIVEEHGGMIKARNHASGGALFEIYLPLSESKKEI
jgi:signal transduction histidine kinase